LQLCSPHLSPYSQAAPSDSLFKTIQTLDTQLFDAYNHCDLEKFGSLIADDIEFYHDKTGLSRGRQALVEGSRTTSAAKSPENSSRHARGLSHRQLRRGRDRHPPLPSSRTREPASVGEAKFIHLWQNQDGVWKVTRVISFDHHSQSK
jgi:hypothetical protein